MDKFFEIENLENGITISHKRTSKFYSPNLLNQYNEDQIKMMMDKIKTYDFSAYINDDDDLIINICNEGKYYVLLCIEIFPDIEKNPLELNDIELRKMVKSLCNKVHNLSCQITKQNIEMDKINEDIYFLRNDIQNLK